MKVLEPLGWHFELGDGRNNMPLDLSLLTGFLGPFAYILFDVGPDELVRYGLSGPFYAWVPKAMDYIKYTASVGKWHKRACRSVRHINKEVCRTNFHLSEAETCLCISS